nr:hypothetical protein LVJ77_06760 [Conchiformibius kuhniae]
MHLFIAETLTPAKLPGDEPEPLQTVAVPLSDVDKLIACPQTGDARILASLFLFRDEYLSKHSTIQY